MKVHPKTPKKLIKVFEECEWKYHKLAKRLDINVGHLHRLIKKGIPPKRLDLQRKLYLTRKKFPEELETARMEKKKKKELVDQQVDKHFQEVMERL